MAGWERRGKGAAAAASLKSKKHRRQSWDRSRLFTLRFLEGWSGSLLWRGAIFGKQVAQAALAMPPRLSPFNQHQTVPKSAGNSFSRTPCLPTDVDGLVFG